MKALGSIKVAGSQEESRGLTGLRDRRRVEWLSGGILMEILEKKGAMKEEARESEYKLSQTL